MKQISLTLTLNGNSVTAAAEPRTHLADFIRENQNLTGTHIGCEHGVCGACTVLAGGVPIRSCITFAVACEGAEIETIESFDGDEIMQELRAAFTREHALQCGYCTPGMLISARDLAIRSPSADEKEIRRAMSGNLCRCTGYAGIIRAIAGVIADRRARGIEPDPGAGRQALGPAGSGHAGGEGAPSIAASPRSSQPRSERLGSVAPRIGTSWTPQVSFEQRFTVAFPRQDVWDIFGRTSEIAACLPGTSLMGEPSADRVKGQIRVKVGPIIAEFRGEAQIERDESTYSGRILGSGTDLRSSSTTRGLIFYRLLPAGDGTSTEVLVTVGYTLTGILAQFGRTSIVKEVAARLTTAFVSNLEARLSGNAGNSATVESTSVNALSLLFSIVADKFRSFLRSIFSRT